MSQSRHHLVGADIQVANDIQESIARLKGLGYSFVSMNMFHPELKRDYLTGSKDMNKRYPITRTDLIFQEAELPNMAQLIVGRVSPWIDCDSPDEYYRRNSELALFSELSWCSHVDLPAVQIVLRRPSNPNLARIINAFLNSERRPFRVWIQVPLCLLSRDETIGIVCNQGCSGVHMSEDTPNRDSWHWWSEFISLCHENSNSFGVVLDVPCDMPSDSRILQRWFSEPVMALRIDTSLFYNNRKGYPILSPAHQRFIKWFYKLNLQVMISGLSRCGQNENRYSEYMHYLYNNMTPDDVYAAHTRGMDDFLQEPLQPLADNLSSATYTVFEMDPYKYRAYEQAVLVALKEKLKLPLDENAQDGPAGGSIVNGEDKESAQELPTSGHGDSIEPIVTTNSPSSPIIIMVLGAGRGPLVDASLRAAKRAGVPVRVYVVEKNPNAIVTLRSRLDDDWHMDDVVFLPGDMRNHEPHEKADIFVSELLGSFGDNELSPECLNGAQKYLKSDGVSIPCSYTSFLAPLQSWKIYKEVTGQSVDRSKPEYAPFETPYVVSLKNCHVLTSPQPAFTFYHPNQDELDNGSRFVSLSYHITQDAIVHGFAGYFDSVLYGNVHMSTHPERHSPDMFSWFPIVFPLRTPVHVKAGDCLTVHMWRIVSPRGVWYEWCVTEPVPGPLHNPGGRSYTIGI